MDTIEQTTANQTGQQAATEGSIEPQTSGQAPLSEAKDTASGSEKKPEASAGVGIPLYTPNYKFNTTARSENNEWTKKEMEIDEWARPFIKDQETEKKVRELFEKAYGIDFLKNKNETFSKEIEATKKDYSTLQGAVNEAFAYKNLAVNKAGELVNGVALEKLFEHIALPKEAVYQWVLKELEKRDLPPEQRKVYDERDQKDLDGYNQSRQIEETEARYRDIASKAMEAEINFVLARPEVNPIVQAYDTQNGQGAFRQFVAEYGVMHFNAYGEDPSAEQAISAVIKRLGDAYKGKPAEVANPTASEKPLPVIPNVSGKGVSPTRKAPRSIEDIRKLAAEANA